MVKTVELRDVSFTYRGRTKAAISNINLSFEKGRVALILGRSGSGKTSLIRVINGLIPHFYQGDFRGQIYFYDEDITSLTASERFKLGISTVMQFPEDQLLSRKVWRSVAFGLANLGYPREVIMRNVRWALKLVEMEYYFDKEVRALSAGQKQKVALASALAIEPELLLLDEPTSQLDPLSAVKFLDTLKNVTNDLGLTVIISEHRTDELIDSIDRVIVLDHGEVALQGPPIESFYRKSLLDELGIKIPTLIRLGNILGLKLSDIDKNDLIMALRKRIEEIKPRTEIDAVTRREKEPVIVIRDLSFRYNKEWVLENLNFNIYKGELLVIMGHNGSGKTTLAKLLVGLLKPNTGNIYYVEKKLSNPNFKDLVGYVAYAPQNPEDLIFHQTVYDEIAFPLRLRGLKKDKLESMAKNIARKFDLIDILFKSPYSISGGEKLRVILASIYALDPTIYILDEPTRGLDWRLKRELVDLLFRMRNEGKTVIFITHDIELITDSNVDRIIVLNKGKVWLEGTKKEVLMNRKIIEAKLVRPVICEITASIGYSDIISIDNLVKNLRGSD